MENEYHINNNNDNNKQIDISEELKKSPSYIKVKCEIDK